MTTLGWNVDRRDVLATTAATALLPLVGPGMAAASAHHTATGTGRNLPFDADWRFHRGQGHGFEDFAFDDSGWRLLDLPHDWSVEDIPGGQSPDQTGPFDKTAIGGNATGFTIGGEGWYRKRFKVDEYPDDARLEVLFGGAYLECDVWLNGRSLGSNVHGYIPFAFDLTPHIIRGSTNVLAVRVRNLGKNTRWYAGSGLYRSVTLDVLPAGVRLARWGVGAWTRRIDGGRAEIDVSTALDIPETVKALETGLELVSRLRDATGRMVAEVTSSIAGPAAGEVKQTLTVRGPKLWSPATPALYTLESELRQRGHALDRIEQPFGIRIVAFDSQRGMTINGVSTKLYGGCVHHDNGLLGSRAFADADERRIGLLKARGYNAIRSAHNPSSKSLRAACDRQGMLLIEEAFDVWHVSKEPQDFATHFRERWEEVIPAMVLPARNSPSVIMWSIGNEIPDRSTDEGVRWSWMLANAVKRLDPTRPVTAGLNGALGSTMIAGPETATPRMASEIDNASTIFIDIPGYNYRFNEAQREFTTSPDRVVYASETFPKDVFAYSELTRRTPLFLGEFVWTAMDYIGEAGIGANAQLKLGSPPFYFAQWPWVNAWCGDLDLTGRQKAQSLARDVAWGVSPLELVVQRPVSDGMFEWTSSWSWPDELQSWSWPGSEGKPLSVRAYTSAEMVELLLNGTKVGEKHLTQEEKMCAVFDVPYATGVIEAVAWTGDREIGRRKIETVGAPARLRIVPERAALVRDRHSLAFVSIEVLDAKGRILPDDKRPVSLTISGPAELVAFGSAEPYAVGSLNAAQAHTFRGRALAILRSTGATGTVRIEASTPELANAVTSLRTAPHPNST